MLVRAEPLVRALSNKTSRNLLEALAHAPSHPRALARRLGVTEGQAQRRLRALEAAGLVRSAWVHEGRTVKRYSLAASEVRFSFDHGFHGEVAFRE